ncbi:MULTISPECIES: hypothetical protein [unclassified Arcicella]|nr:MULTISPECIES: hypothetical protein [unclassified Arcicella]MDR6563555.1 hypothetical protein [Arcicella sp. BE51]MDR6813333.1 hypothetical protein [Arcicella sp. BE140]
MKKSIQKYNTFTSETESLNNFYFKDLKITEKTLGVVQPLAETKKNDI